jgi:hypothetical protein
MKAVNSWFQLRQRRDEKNKENRRGGRKVEGGWV